MAQTSPRLSFKNLAEKINCILNLCLYGIGCMCQHSSDAEFEFKIGKLSMLKLQRRLTENEG